MPHGTDLRSSGIRLLAVAAAFVVVGVASQGVAQTCIVTTPIGVDDTGTAIAVQSDGKIVLGGYARIGGNDDFAVVRYNPDFSLDLSFGTNGVVTTDFFGGQDRVEAIAIQPDAKIVVAGHATNVTRDFAIARYNVDGSLDGTFGTLGKATSDITGNNDEIEGVAVDATGRIVVAGFSQNAMLDYVVARYDATGNLDTAGFAAPNGYFVSTNGATNDVATAVAIQPSDGNIVLGGWANNGANDDFSAVRFDVNGAIDPSFGGGPVLVPVGAGQDRAYAMALQSDGKVLLAGAALVGFDRFGVVRLNTNGTVDTATFNPAGTFGDAPNIAGRVATDFSGLHDRAYGVVQQADNKIVVVGWANWDGGASNVDFALARYNADGSLDGGFSGGTVTTAVGANNDWIDSVALQANGKIVVGGYSDSGSDDDFAAARYNTDGTLDAGCSGACTPLTTSEGAGTITVTASGRFEMRFNTATGGGVDEFFDLADDLSRTYDLAGGVARVEALFTDGLNDGGGFFNTDQNDLGSKLDLLEATPTRVRVRQEAFYQQENGTNILAGVKGFGDYSVYPAGRVALRWSREATSGATYTVEELDLVVHPQSAGQLSNWDADTQGSAGPFPVAVPPGPDPQDFNLFAIDTASVKTDFLSVMYRDWTTAEGHLADADEVDWMLGGGEEWGILVWRESTGAVIPAGSSETWDFLTYFKPTDFTGQGDLAVTGRSTDYRGPSSLSVMIGGPWLDPSENTGGGDDFNEVEAAYPLTFDPALGLRFDIDGGTTRRYSPFFKIRQWRSLQDPQVTLGGTTLANDVDFKADVKPIARSRFANGIRFHSTLEVAGSVTNPDIGDGTGSTVSGPSFTAARYGQGARFAAATDFIDVPLISGGQNIELDRGRIEFWYQSAYAHDDGVEHYLFDLDNNGGLSRIRVVKQNGGSSNQLLYEVVDSGGTPHQAVIASTDYSWRANDWVHLAFTWDRSDATDNVKAYLNGTSLVPQSISNGTFSMEAEDPLGAMRLGNRIVGGTSTNADGIFDEWFIHQEDGDGQIGARRTRVELLRVPGRCLQ